MSICRTHPPHSSFFLVRASHQADEFEGNEYSDWLSRTNHKLKSLKIHPILENLKF